MEMREFLFYAMAVSSVLLGFCGIYEGFEHEKRFLRMTSKLVLLFVVGLIFVAKPCYIWASSGILSDIFKNIATALGMLILSVSIYGTIYFLPRGLEALSEIKKFFKWFFE